MKYFFRSILVSLLSVAAISCANGSSGSGAQSLGSREKTESVPAKPNVEDVKNDSGTTPESMTVEQKAGIESLRRIDSNVAIFDKQGLKCGCNPGGFSCGSGKPYNASQCSSGYACCY